MNKKFKNISDLFTKDFFENLLGFIFDEDFNSFYLKVKKGKTYNKFYDNSLWQYDAEDYSTSKIYPISYDDFLKMYNEVENCAKTINERLIRIKYLMKELFYKKDSKHLQNQNICIQLNKNIVLNEYKKVFIDGLYNTNLNSLTKYSADDNNFLVFKKQTSIDFLAEEIIISIFNYIQRFLETLLENIVKDNEIIINSYTQETRHKILSLAKNKTKQENAFCREIKNECKKNRNVRLNKEKGRPKREITGYFPRLDKLEIAVQRIKDELNEHPFIKQELRRIIKGEDREVVRKNILNYLENKEDVITCITLDGEYEIKGNKGFITDFSPELLMVIDNYIDFKPLSSTEEYFCLKSVILYTLLEISGDLDNFINPDDDLLTLKNILNYFGKKNKEIFTTKK